ncbi:MAG: hypothetical protein KatS3mg068_2137 [Candidatus Sericytochromatia bacterium]|nr:MAG: hypothetical protein KatS3mg068_2137 [Candidatus Sericytochromatia bacterium]
MSKIEELEALGDNSKRRAQAWEIARQFQQSLNRNHNNSQNHDLTNNKKDSSLVENSVQKNQEIFDEAYGEAGSISGSYNAGSTVLAGEKSNTNGGDFSGGGNNNPHSKGDSIKMESKKLKESSLKNVEVKLFDD